jgi:hypothetical protein
MLLLVSFFCGATTFAGPRSPSAEVSTSHTIRQARAPARVRAHTHTHTHTSTYTR